MRGSRIYIIAVALVLLLLIYTIGFQSNWFWTNGTLLLGWILFICQILYNRGTRFYWAVQKIKYWFLNPDTEWDLTIKYISQSIDYSTLQNVQNALYKTAIFDRPTVRKISEQRFEIRADELTIEVYYENGLLEVFFTKIPVSYRGSLRKIRNRIVPVIENIEDCLTVKEKAYWLTVYFEDVNPYIGLYLKRLGQKDVSELNIRVNLGKSESIIIHKETMTVSTNTLSDLVIKVQKYLTLSQLPTLEQ